MWHNYITVVSLHHYNKYSAWFLDIRIYQLVLNAEQITKILITVLKNDIAGATADRYSLSGAFNLKIILEMLV